MCLILTNACFVRRPFHPKTLRVSQTLQSLIPSSELAMNAKMILAPGFWPANQKFCLVLYKSITIRICCSTHCSTVHIKRLQYKCSQLSSSRIEACGGGGDGVSADNAPFTRSHCSTPIFDWKKQLLYMWKNVTQNTGVLGPW